MEGREIIDISPVIHSGLGVFPGDTPFQQSFLLSLQRGDGFTLSKIESTVHLGAHVDAPSHYVKQGATMEARPLDLYLGPAQVVEVRGCRGRRILPADFANTKIQAPRLLFKTLSFPDPNHWNSDFSALSAQTVEFLAKAGVRLVGIDTPSIDPEDDKDLESHHAVARHDMAILEGIVLEKVPEGSYQLIALPLRLQGSDASPVRACLLK